MGRRSLKGHVASCSTGFLRVLNVIVALGGIPLLVLTFMIRPMPTLAGWGLVVLGVLVILSGLFGTCAVNQQGCCSCIHLFFVLFSLAGCVVVAVIAFVNPAKIADAMSATITEPPPQTMVKGIGIVCFFVFCFQLLVMLVGCMINCCGLTDYYEDLEGASEKELAKQAQDDERRRSQIEATSAHQLAVKMKEKYGIGAESSK